MRCTRSLAGGAGLALCFTLQMGCSSKEDDASSRSGAARDPIINGVPLPTNVGTNSVELYLDCSGQGIQFCGNGIALNDRWVLTAAHVVADVFDAHNASDPFDDEYQAHRDPASTFVGFGDSAASILPVADLIIPHPRWRQIARDNQAPFSVDVALVRLKTPVPELAAFVRPLYGGTATDLLNFTANPINCTGSGPNAEDGSGSGIRRFTFPQPTLTFGLDDYFITEEDPILQHYFWPGDSGTACVHVASGSVAGILSWASVNQPRTLTDFGGVTRVVPAHAGVFNASESYREFVVATIGANAPPIIFDSNRLGQLDNIFLYQDPGTSVYTTAIIFGEDDIPDFSASVDLSFFGVTDVIASAAGGEFGNGTGFDLAAVIGGILVSVSGTDIPTTPGALAFAPQLTFAPLADDYATVQRIDFNGDAFDDLQAIREDGTADIYVGGATGLVAQDGYFGMPSVDQNDGKFLLVTSKGTGTYDWPEQSILIDVPASESGFSLDVFDGDLGGLNDLPTGGTCFRLWTAPFKDQESPDAAPIVERFSTTLGDDAWTNLYAGPIHDQALGDGHYSYRLDVYLTDDCDSPANPETLSANRYKVRSTGQLSIEYGSVAMIGSDAAGAFARVRPDVTVPDYDYDGEWSLFFDVPDADSSIVLTDLDADDLENPPAQATGMNAEIGYVLFDPNGELLSVPVVSGDYAASRGTFSVNQQFVDARASGTHVWRWSNVLSENGFHVDAQGTGVEFALSGSQTARVSAFDSDTPEEWQETLESNPGSFEPVVLGRSGTAGGRLFVPNAGAAVGILAATGGSSFEALRAELLAAELNARRGSPGGRTELTSALLYGTRTAVSDVFQQAHDAIARGQANVPAAELAELLRSLRAINASQVSFAGSRNALPTNFSADDDGDGVANDVDNCRQFPNPDQADWNHDRVGSACEPQPAVRCVLDQKVDSRQRRCGRPHHRSRKTELVFFGFDNPGPELHIARGPTNVVNGGDGVPNTRFTSGSTPISFVARSSGPDVTWRLGQLAATASRTSPRCGGFELTELDRVRNAVLWADGELEIGRGATVGERWDIVNAGEGKLEVGERARIGDAFAEGSIVVNPHAQTGILSANERVTLRPRSTSAGVIERADLDLDPLAWTVRFPHEQRRVGRLDRNQHVTLEPGSYGSVSVGRAHLTLRSGTYYFQSLELDRDATWSIDATAGPVFVYVRDRLEVRVTPTGSTGADVLLIGYFGDDSVRLTASLDAMVVAPNAKLSLGSGHARAFRGRYFARDLELEPNVTLTLN